MKKTAIFALLLFVLATFVSCTKKEDVIVIGVNLALTGVSAPYGNDALAGVLAATSEQNALGGVCGKSIRLIIRDNASKSDLAAAFATGLEEKRVCAILGPSLSHLVRPALKGLKKNTCLITMGATATNLRPAGCENAHLIRLSFTDKLQGETLANAAFEIGLRKFAAVYDPASDYSLSLTEAFCETFSSLGGEICALIPFTAQTTEVAPLLQKALANQPDALLLPLFYDKGGLFLRALRQQTDLPVFSGDAFDSPNLLSLAGGASALEGVYFTDHADPDSLQLDGRPLSSYEALGYDSAKLLFFALQELLTEGKSINDTDLLYHALLNAKPRLLAGAVTFSPEGDAQKTPVLLTFVDGAAKKAGEAS